MGLSKIIFVCVFVVAICVLIILNQVYEVKFNNEDSLLWIYDENSLQGIKVSVGRYYFQICETSKTIENRISTKEVFRIGNIVIQRKNRSF